MIANTTVPGLPGDGKTPGTPMSDDTPGNDTLGIEIDGRACRARKGRMVIEVADANAVPIPR